MIYRVSAHFKELFKMKILVIVDMQNDFINGALGTPEAQAVVGDVAKKISGFDGDLICITKDTHRSADYLKTQEGQLLLEGRQRKDFFATHPPKAVYVFSKRVNPLRNGLEVDENGKPWSSTMCFAWFVWEHGYTGEPCIRWI